MSVLDELKQLARLFPRAGELAVSPEMLTRYEDEITWHLRFVEKCGCIAEHHPIERLRARHNQMITVRRLPLLYCGKRLTLVESQA